MSEIKRDVEYLVFEDKGVVVCKLWNCHFIALDRLAKYSFFSVWNPEKYLVDDVFVGVAKCAPEDKFDLEYGKKLALTRAKIKRGNAVNNAIRTFIADVDKALTRLENEAVHRVPEIEDIK